MGDRLAHNGLVLVVAISLTACEDRPSGLAQGILPLDATPLTLTIGRDEPTAEHNGVLVSESDGTKLFGTLHLVASLNQADRSSDSFRLTGTFHERDGGRYLQVGADFGFEGLTPDVSTTPRAGTVQRYDSSRPSSVLTLNVSRVSVRKGSDGQTEVLMFTSDGDAQSEAVLRYRGLLFLDCQLLQDDENLIGASIILGDRMFASAPCAEFARWANGLTSTY